MYFMGATQPPIHPLLLQWWLASLSSPSLLQFLVLASDPGGKVSQQEGARLSILHLWWGCMLDCVCCMLRKEGSQAAHAAWYRWAACAMCVAQRRLGVDMTAELGSVLLWCTCPGWRAGMCMSRGIWAAHGEREEPGCVYGWGGSYSWGCPWICIPYCMQPLPAEKLDSPTVDFMSPSDVNCLLTPFCKKPFLGTARLSSYCQILSIAWIRISIRNFIYASSISLTPPNCILDINIKRKYDNCIGFIRSWSVTGNK